MGRTGGNDCAWKSLIPFRAHAVIDQEWSRGGARLAKVFYRTQVLMANLVVQ
jgi:hypothetical protein